MRKGGGGDLSSLRATVLRELAIALGAVDEGGVNALREAIRGAPRVFVAGKGRSGLQARAFAMRLMQLGMTAFVVDDVTTPGLRADDLLLIASGSGRTPSLVAYAERAKKMGARVALVTIQTVSPIAQAADVIVCIPAPSPKLETPLAAVSILPMGSLFEQALGILFEILIAQLMGEMEITTAEMFERHANLE
jgi:6-phospho-3-hexuloisomerase